MRINSAGESQEKYVLLTLPGIGFIAELDLAIELEHFRGSNHQASLGLIVLNLVDLLATM